MTLVEKGEGGQIRTGEFLGRIPLAAVVEGVDADAADNVLACDELDELVVSYTDEVHLYGDEPRDTESVIKVSGSVNSARRTQSETVFPVPSSP